ncbi:E3 ubiquitin-protein ligase At4g11680 [Zea mays]|uniref:RING/U-box superfamily protein n=1 Tax=Zea mays TaxID=4577 RepID=A0A1D6NEK1_MAIZE|nr:E3 ubiquitin-protein ligase At4g11680 [Zea mays]ONM38911.1 RING/U-box superfamily protein [Zea mays]|eukprot:XP_008675134.2 E3 ubiquitin-protein ligase At4g11680 [Zea mays]
MRPPSSSSSSSSSPAAVPEPGGRMSALTMRAVARMSRARWFVFLRRVYQYQNGPRSDLGSNPFNSPGWLALELGVIVAQVVLTTAVVATSAAERPAWPLRLWVAAYNVGNVLSLPLLYWRHRHSSSSSSAGGGRGDLEMHGANDAPGNRSYLMNKARAFLELFFAMWFVMGNVWVFDARLGSFQRAPRLYALCVSLLAWNAVVYSLPFLLFLLLCCFVPAVGYALGYNMNSASVGRGASDEQLAALPRWRFKEPDVARDRERDDQECCICLAQYGEKEEVRQLPCTHVFHLKCVDRWLRIISSCPLCKQELK